MHAAQLKYFVLLASFVFGVMPYSGIASNCLDLLCMRDTLIIDGDTIFIERDDSALASDSTALPEKGAAPIAKQRLHIWNAGVGLGVNNTISSFQTFSSNLSTLNDFVGRRHPVQTNALAYVDFGARFASVNSPNGKIELSLVTGAGLNQIKSQYLTLVNEDQLLVDSLLRFGSEANELFYEYFTITEPPDIGEVDTFFVDVVSQKMTYNTLDVPLKLRVTLNRNNRPIRYFIESGIVRRFVLSSQIPANHYLLNSSGTWQAFSPSDFMPKRLITPHFAAGVERKLPFRGALEQQYFTYGASLAASLPSISINEGSLLVLDVSAFSITFFSRFFF